MIKEISCLDCNWPAAAFGGSDCQLSRRGRPLPRPTARPRPRPWAATLPPPRISILKTTSAWTKKGLKTVRFNFRLCNFALKFKYGNLFWLELARSNSLRLSLTHTWADASRFVGPVAATAKTFCNAQFSWSQSYTTFFIIAKISSN